MITEKDVEQFIAKNTVLTYGNKKFFPNGHFYCDQYLIQIEGMYEENGWTFYPVMLTVTLTKNDETTRLTKDLLRRGKLEPVICRALTKGQGPVPQGFESIAERE